MGGLPNGLETPDFWDWLSDFFNYYTALAISFGDLKVSNPFGWEFREFYTFYLLFFYNCDLDLDWEFDLS